VLFANVDVAVTVDAVDTVVVAAVVDHVTVDAVDAVVAGVAVVVLLLLLLSLMLLSLWSWWANKVVGGSPWARAWRVFLFWGYKRVLGRLTLLHGGCC
jgi:hypothetical protein